MGKRLIIVIILTLVTVAMWIGLEVVLNLTGPGEELEYNSYMTPISSEFNEDAIDEILRREEERLIVDRDVLE